MTDYEQIVWFIHDYSTTYDCTVSDAYEEWKANEADMGSIVSDELEKKLKKELLII